MESHPHPPCLAPAQPRPPTLSPPRPLTDRSETEQGLHVLLLLSLLLPPQLLLLLQTVAALQGVQRRIQRLRPAVRGVSQRHQARQGGVGQLLKRGAAGHRRRRLGDGHRGVRGVGDDTQWGMIFHSHM